MRLACREDWQCCIGLTVGLDRVARILTRASAHGRIWLYCSLVQVFVRGCATGAAGCAVSCVGRRASVQRRDLGVGGCVRSVVVGRTDGCCASRSVMSRRTCGTVGTGYGLIGADRSGLLVPSVVRFARCNVSLPFFAVRLPVWHNWRPEFMVAVFVVGACALTGPRLEGSVARCWSVVSAARRWRVLSRMVPRRFARSELEREQRSVLSHDCAQA